MARLLNNDSKNGNAASNRKDDLTIDGKMASSEKGKPVTGYVGASAAEDDGNCEIIGAGSGLVPIPPDGGWGWVVTMASFMVGVIVDGICFTFGFFFNDFQEHFGTNRSVTASINSVLSGTYLTVGPLVSALVNIYGCRKVAMIGAVVTSVSFFVCTFSPDINVMILLYGFCGGLGFGLMYLPAIVMVGYYFDKRRALATGIAVCGSGVGSFVFAPLSELLLGTYNWKGAMWILSGLSLNGAVFAALFRPLSYNESQSVVEKSKEDEFEPSYEKEAKAPLVNPVVQIMKTDSPIYRCKSMESCHETSNVARLGNSMVLLESGTNVHSRNSKSWHVMKPMDRKDIFYSGSVQHLPEYVRAGNEVNFVRSMLSVHEKNAEEDTETTESSCGKIFKTMFDFSLLKSPTFVLYLMACFLCMMGFFVPFIYIPEIAKENGMSSSQSAWIISSIGIVNSIGRILVGWVSDKPCTDALSINNVALIVGGVFTMFVPLYKAYAMIITYAVIFGLCIGALFDATGDYTVSFYLAGAVIAASGLCCLPLRRVSRWEKRREQLRKDAGKSNKK
ncbi:monocarboxylate transporter 12-B-like isoform X2 [Dreissena polymorpha]|uniref:monocarboxylate transporter 12-B-like isoform X2 n=1 Tax=Dreissena polymorpha TaxID=45954 RepID=UPI0022651245|nr:monocarboxylate transporter 12-B-like isoform X2 [Dreissena polymorpha]